VPRSIKRGWCFALQEMQDKVLARSRHGGWVGRGPNNIQMGPAARAGGRICKADPFRPAGSYPRHYHLVPKFQPLPFVAIPLFSPCWACCLVSLRPPSFVPGLLRCPSQLSRSLHPPGLCSSSHAMLRKRPQTPSSSPVRAGACCLGDHFRGGMGAEEAKRVGWFCRSFQLPVSSPESSEDGDSVTPSKSCACVLSQFLQGAFNENTVAAGV